MKKVLSSVLCILLLSLIIPFKVFADNTAYQLAPLSYEELGTIDGYTYNWKRDDNSDIRTVAIQYGNNSIRLYAVCLTRYKVVRFQQGNTTNGIQSYNARNVSGTTYYLDSWYINQDVFRTRAINIYIDKYGYQSGSTNEFSTADDMAVYYTFGDGAIIEPVITYGDLNDVGFYTKFTNSQQSNLQTTKYNLDVFTWDNTYDVLGNQINVPVGEFVVDIQGAMSDYEANTKSDLLNQVLNDATIGTWSEIATVSANAGTYQLTWEQAARSIMGIYDYNTNIFEELVVRPIENYFTKKGWIYRIRLRKSDDSYVGNWQIVYNITSMPPKDSNNVINHYYVYNNTLPSEDTNDVLQTINNYNNTNNNWYINDTPMNVDDNSNWLEKLLEFLIGVVDKIVSLITHLLTNILDGLLDLILSLFGNIDLKDLFFGWFSDLKDYIDGIDLTLPIFNLPIMPQVNSFNRLVQETMNIFINNNLGFVLFIPLILLIVRIIL